MWKTAFKKNWKDMVCLSKWSVLHKFYVVHSWILCPIFLSSCLVCSSSFMPVSFLLLELCQILSKGIWSEIPHPANIYLFKVNKTNTRKRCEIYSKLMIVNNVQSHWRHSGVFIVNFKHINLFFLMFLLLILNRLMRAR